ncbi:redox-regulated ATPase YchF [bacterium]|nr:redox-regulated ATPase YchF [bacterium]|tara:strand:+ start:166 stop:1176 length:1011 start_codon:yes stop_codon:yes gene_type:complete
MNISIGIVGLPNVGKSTLFNILTKQAVLAANYPFATIDPNVGIVPVPDERIDTLADISESVEKIPAVVEFYDIAGLVKGASTGEGLGNQFLTHIRETSAICMVLRVFPSSDVVHVEGEVDALRDLEILETELVLKDFETISSHLDKVTKQARSGDKKEALRKERVEELYAALDGGKPLYVSDTLSEEAREIAGELGLLTTKRQIFLLNGKEEDVSAELRSAIEERRGAYVISDLGTATDVSGLIGKAYETLGLMSFFTTGEKETRAWTVRRGALAPEAAGVIHTDFEEKFIRMDVVSYDDFISCGGWSGARSKGKARTEGREYEVADGDVVLVKHG